MSFEIGLNVDSRHVKSLKKHNLHLFKLKMFKSTIKKKALLKLLIWILNFEGVSNV